MSSNPGPKPMAEDPLANFPGVGDILEGRYELVRLIGHGGMGTVLEGRHLRLERKVAIKLVHPALAGDEKFARRFQREVRITKELTHPNTVRIYDFGATDAGVMYLVMELLEGRELQDEIDKGPMPVADVIELGGQLLDGLGEAHAIDVIHRDIKPGNLFLTHNHRQQRVLKILDFGIAKSMEADQPAITRANSVIGTASYLAPEVICGDQASKQSDIYACGMILLEMLFGQRVVKGDSFVDKARKHISLPPLIPPSLQDHPLAAVLERALTKNPVFRFADAEEMFEAIYQIPESMHTRRTVPQDEIDALFQTLYGAKDELSGGEKEATLATPSTSQVVSDQGDDSGEADPEWCEETTALIHDFVEQTTREVRQLAERSAHGVTQTVVLDEELIERAMKKAHQIAEAVEFEEDLPEATVEVSQKRIQDALHSMQRHVAATIEVTDELIEQSRSAIDSDTVGGTIELTDEILSEVSIGTDDRPSGSASNDKGIVDKADREQPIAPSASVDGTVDATPTAHIVDAAFDGQLTSRPSSDDSVFTRRWVGSLILGFVAGAVVLAAMYLLFSLLG